MVDTRKNANIELFEQLSEMELLGDFPKNFCAVAYAESCTSDDTSLYVNSLSIYCN